jgi:ABC-2 type transport system ATP-binding protein
VTLWPTLTGGEVIDLLGKLRGGLDSKRRAELLERFALDPTQKTRAYSKGNRQKVALVAALASDAELLLLDEPTSGLDPLMEAVFRQCAEEERARGRTILLSSHILSEVEALCDRVTIIRAGRTVETGTLAELRHLTRTSIAAELAGQSAALADLSGVHDLVVDPGKDGGSRVRCEVDSDRLEDLLRLLVAARVKTLTSQPPTLEELFLRHYEKEPADTAGRSAAATAAAKIPDAR